MTRHLITSALPYINGVKHLGNLVGSLLPADVYARFLRRRGEPVLFICATDEHGAPAELAAAEQGMDVRAYCDQLHAVQADLCARFGIAFDHFGRSSSAENRDLTQHLYRRLDEQGLIEERNLRQVYSLADGRFLPDRYVVGTCPRCGYDAARGDQCENCTTLLDATELIRPRSVISGSTDLEVRESRHLFLRLPLLADRVKAWVDAHPDWPLLTKSIALGWLKEGLHDRGITRDLTWGVPVPRPGFQGKVFYVWFDAPVEYIAATKEHFTAAGNPDQYLHWWRDQTDVTYTQFMAKDNVPFHTVMWPAVLLGADEGWKQVDYVKAFNWLTYYGGKFSTSNHRGVFMDQALDLLPADYWRYALLAHAPETDDASFTWPQFQSTCNKDLADTFGNFVSRVLKLTASKFGPAVPAGGTPGPAEAQLHADCAALLAAYAGHLSRSEFGKAVGALRGIWTLGNVYIDGRAPWSLVKADRDAAAAVLRTCINLIRIYAVAAWPVIPFAAERVYGWLHLTDAERQPDPADGCNLDALAPGRPFDIPDPLFRKIDDAEVAEWARRFGTHA